MRLLQCFAVITGFIIISSCAVSEKNMFHCLLLQLVKSANLELVMFLNYSKNTGLRLTLTPTLVLPESSLKESEFLS